MINFPRKLDKGMLVTCYRCVEFSSDLFNILDVSGVSNGSKVLIIRILILMRLHVLMNLYPRPAVQGISKL